MTGRTQRISLRLGSITISNMVMKRPIFWPNLADGWDGRVGSSQPSRSRVALSRLIRPGSLNRASVWSRIS